jgi:hypothetical protein
VRYVPVEFSFLHCQSHETLRGARGADVDYMSVRKTRAMHSALELPRQADKNRRPLRLARLGGAVPPPEELSTQALIGERKPRRAV